MTQSITSAIYVSRLNDVTAPSPVDLFRTLFDLTDVDANKIQFYCVDTDSGPDILSPLRTKNTSDGFRVRARFLSPIFHPIYPEFRRCPNFPDIYVNKEGVIYEECLIGARVRSTISAVHHSYCDYLETVVPCSQHPKLVSMFRIYADAWGKAFLAPPARPNPVPRDGNWTNYSVGNIKWVPPYRNIGLAALGKKEFAYVSPENILSPFSTGEEWLDKLRCSTNIDDDRSDFLPLPYLTTDPTLAFVTNAYGTSRDICYQTQWYRFVVDCDTMEIHACRSIKDVIEAISVCGGPNVSKNWVRKNGDCDRVVLKV